MEKGDPWAAERDAVGYVQRTVAISGGRVSAREGEKAGGSLACGGGVGRIDAERASLSAVTSGVGGSDEGEDSMGSG